ncbi:MAG TPA: hydroxyacid dehydrogenase [Stellaceae bacterium]|nr:hydroxyacid dehydrogenase [Stellaceae bacterium]
MTKILVTNASIDPAALAMIRARGAEALFAPISTPPAELRRIVEREAVEAIISRTIRIDGATMDASPRLKVISKHGAGVDNIDLEAATARGIPVLFALAGNARSVAEHAIAMMLALAKRLVPLDAALRRGAWPREGGQGIELAGKRLGIVGLGNIGRIVAELGRAFGMAVAGFDPYVAAAALPAGIERRLTLADLLSEADIVTLHCPLTAETRGLMGGEALRLMKRTAFLVNTARGPIIDEAALIAALREGRIAGAALDSFTEEPADPRSPLWSLPNAIYTPHIAGTTAEAFARVAMQAVENVFAILDGAPPDPHCVANPEALRRPLRRR